MALLVILGGLPGVGKTTLARSLAEKLGAVHLRIDSIEQALRSAIGSDIEDLGYRAAYAVARDNLMLGRTVIADSVNPIAITRAAWRDVAASADARAVKIEIVCSDAAEHRRRVETRSADIVGHALPAWSDVLARDYEPWPEARVIDTASVSLAASLAEIEEVLR